jgi:hypothetical protein
MPSKPRPRTFDPAARLTLGELADLTRINRQRLAGYASQGAIPTGPATLAEWLEPLVQAEARRLASGQVDDSDARYQAARAGRMAAMERIAKADADAREGLTTPTAAVHEIIGRWILGVRAHMLAMPAKVAPVVDPEDPPRAFAIINRATRDALASQGRAAPEDVAGQVAELLTEIRRRSGHHRPAPATQPPGGPSADRAAVDDPE